MPCVRGRYETQRTQQFGADEMALQSMRRIHHATLQLEPKASQGVSSMAFGQAASIGARYARKDI